MWTDARYEPGETTPMELVACRHRYHAPIGRTVFLGTPPADVLRVAEGVVEGLTAALDAIRPGVACEEVEAVWRTTAARFGIEKPSRLGYSFGIAYPPTWGDRTLSLRPGDRTLLEPGMTLHVIPGIWLADWGVVITESIRVTETGCEPLCNLPRQLFVKE
jgi:Xaa-Pro aminopeptidase